MSISVIDAMPGFKFGADPELFVLNLETNEFVSAEGLIPGTKKNPYEVKYGAVQVDGMAAEFNITPVTTFAEWDRNIKAVMRTLQTMLPANHILKALPAVTFSEKVWEGSPECAKELGCSPDFNAWTGKVNPAPRCPENPRLRTASGHVHVGWTEDADYTEQDHIQNCRDLVKQLDWYLGGWSLTQDTDATRRELYGKAGACRFKPYGVEYRVLSNFWLTGKAGRLSVWNRMQQAIWDMREGFIPDMAAQFNDRLVKSIDTSTRDSMLEDAYRFPLRVVN